VLHALFLGSTSGHHSSDGTATAPLTYVHMQKTHIFHLHRFFRSLKNSPKFSCRNNFQDFVILAVFLDHQEAANGSGGQKDPYLSPHNAFKLFTCSVQKLWSYKVWLPNPDTAHRNSTLVVYASGL
jgi:hypothetical protein